MSKSSFNLFKKLKSLKNQKKDEQHVKTFGVPFYSSTKNPEVEKRCSFLKTFKRGGERRFGCLNPKIIHEFLTDVRYTIHGKTYTTKGANLLSCNGCPQALRCKFLGESKSRKG